MRLHELLVTRRTEVTRRWTERLRHDVAPLSHVELADHIPQFLEEVALALRLLESPDSSPTAAAHGTQRLRLGFDIGAVVREYGALRDTVLELAHENDLEIGRLEAQVLSDCVITGIADAVAEYSRQRDAELQRQATEHFAFVAHELRNPLQSARMALALLKQRGHLPDGLASSALERGLERMHELIDHALELARLGTGVDLQLRPVSLASVLRDVATTSAADAAVRDVQLEFRCDEAITLVADVRLLCSAISNLVRNAVKFTRPGSTVDVRARAVDSRVRIEVEDRCGGLRPGFVEIAFAPFTQDDPKHGGFGLGLAIAKQAVEAQRGSIHVENLPAKGCVFVIELPFEQ